MVYAYQALYIYDNNIFNKCMLSILINNIHFHRWNIIEIIRMKGIDIFRPIVYYWYHDTQIFHPENYHIKIKSGQVYYFQGYHKCVQTVCRVISLGFNRKLRCILPIFFCSRHFIENKNRDITVDILITGIGTSPAIGKIRFW